MVKFINRGDGDGDDNGTDSKWESLMERTHEVYNRIWGDDEIPGDRDGEGR